MSTETPYSGLTPDVIITSVESLGYLCDGRLLALNSYENRVYQVGLEDAQPLVVKYYRPHRWSDAAIHEEHAFVQELVEQEIPVVPPIKDADGKTLHEYGGFRFAVYERRGGRQPELDQAEHLEWLGRFIGRIHAVGRNDTYQHRPRIEVSNFGVDSYQYVLEHGFVPAELELSYRAIVEEVVGVVETCFQAHRSVSYIRLHGDCHVGNIMWTDAGPHFVDFDDSRLGPAVQDIWMLLSGDRASRTKQLGYLLDGYSQFNEFDCRELNLIESLRTLRLLHYSAWLARRWQDPAFPAAFPWFESPRYWEDQILTLREQMAALEEPPLKWP